MLKAIRPHQWQLPVWLLTMPMLWLCLASSQPVDAQTKASDATVLQARALLGAGNSDSALVVLETAIAKDSTQVALLFALADAQRDSRKLKARRATLGKILRHEPQSVAARVALAEDFVFAKHLDSAAYFAHEALVQSAGRSAEANYWLGRIHDQSGRPDSALSYYRAAWRRLPDGELF